MSPDSLLPLVWLACLLAGGRLAVAAWTSGARHVAIATLAGLTIGFAPLLVDTGANRWQWMHFVAYFASVALAVSYAARGRSISFLITTIIVVVPLLMKGLYYRAIFGNGSFISSILDVLTQAALVLSPLLLILAAREVARLFPFRSMKA